MDINRASRVVMKITCYNREGEFGTIYRVVDGRELANLGLAEWCGDAVG